LAIFAAITFTGELFDSPVFPKVILGFFVFCGLSSATYIINDIFDVKKDRLHPFKKFRTIATAIFPFPLQLFLAAFLIVVSLSVASMLLLLFLL
jgi:decaprenyl-phosphate phosphoribosyltransferase